MGWAIAPVGKSSKTTNLTMKDVLKIFTGSPFRMLSGRLYGCGEGIGWVKIRHPKLP